MRHQLTLTIASLLSILLFSLHWADEVARGLEPGTAQGVGGLLILAVWLSALLVFPERRFGLIVILVGSILASGVPILHMQGRGLVLAGMAIPTPTPCSSGSGRTSRSARAGCCPSSSRCARFGRSGAKGRDDPPPQRALLDRRIGDPEAFADVASFQGEERMKIRNWGMILLAVWLILMGLIPLLSIHLDNSGTVMNLLAIAAGVLILIGK